MQVLCCPQKEAEFASACGYFGQSPMYLCLEDTLDRLQRRLIEVTGGETGSICLATHAEIMGNGLEAQ